MKEIKLDMKAINKPTKIGAAVGFVTFILFAAVGVFSRGALGFDINVSIFETLPDYNILLYPVIIAKMLLSLLVVGGFYTFVGAAVGHLASELLKPAAETEKPDAKEKATL